MTPECRQVQTVVVGHGHRTLETELDRAHMSPGDRLCITTEIHHSVIGGSSQTTCHS